MFESSKLCNDLQCKLQWHNNPTKMFFLYNHLKEFNEARLKFEL